MARRFRKFGPTDPRGSVERVRIDGARVLETIGEDHPAWSGAELCGEKGMIVRIRPPPEAPEELVEHVREFFERTGAERVMVDPRRRSKPVAEGSRSLPSKRYSKPRDVVAAMAGEAKVDDPCALLELLGSIMDAEGL